MSDKTLMYGGGESGRMGWKRFREGLGSLLPPVQILQPYPDVRARAALCEEQRATAVLTATSRLAIRPAPERRD